MSSPELSTDIATLAASVLPSRGADEPLFRLAWHARLFSLIVSLIRDGRIPWTAFQERLVRHIAASEKKHACVTAEEIDLRYFDCWLETANEMLVAQGFICEHDVAEQIERIHDTVESIRSDQLSRNNGHDPIAVDIPAVL